MLISLLKDYGTEIGAIIAALTFFWSVYKYFDLKKIQEKTQQFETYHRLVKELVEPSTNGTIMLDRQTAIIYELRNFPRYYQHTNRMLIGLLKLWTDSGVLQPRLEEEIKLTIKYISASKGMCC